MTGEILKIFSRELERLKTEIDSFKKEENIWNITGQIKNSAGNLCLHLIGNLSTYIGKNLGQTGYVRNREMEFSQKNVGRETLVQLVLETKIIVEQALKKLEKEDLEKTYPENVLGHEMSTGYFLIHLISHFSYHLGQINYLRRALE